MPALGIPHSHVQFDAFCLVEYKVDTFSSDYDDSVDEFGIELDAHGA